MGKGKIWEMNKSAMNTSCNTIKKNTVMSYYSTAFFFFLATLFSTELPSWQSQISKDVEESYKIFYVVWYAIDIMLLKAVWSGFLT